MTKRTRKSCLKTVKLTVNNFAHIDGMVEGERGRGRPKRSWLTDITETEWTCIRITACEREAEERQKWRDRDLHSCFLL